MPQPSEPQTPNWDEALHGIQDLGNTTESFFSRLYRGLNSRKELREARALLQQSVQQTQQAEGRNRMLRQMIEQRELDVMRLQNILEQVSEGIIMQDMQGRIVMMNQAADDILGSQRNFWMSDLGQLFRESLALQTSGNELAPITEPNQTKIGKRSVSAQVAAISDRQGTPLGTLMILRDVTDEDLADKLKNSFAAHISHELITPLAPMRVASEMLLNAPEDQAPNRRMLEMIGRNIDILDRMVTELLDMSAMTSENFRIRPEPIPLEAMLFEVMSNFEEDFDDKKLALGLMLHETGTLTIAGDPKYMHWALTNLVRNAVQYTENRGKIALSARLNPEQPRQVELRIRDTGTGISDADLPHIFDLFYRGDARTSAGKKLDPRGLGQGLYVAQKIAQAHNGSLQVQSTVGVGSTFTLLVPAAPNFNSLPD